jgi:putative hydrolase of the HAD superfamily
MNAQTKRLNRERQHPSALRNAECWVFDLDNTLYPAAARLFDQIDRRMCAFIADYLKIDHETAYRTQKSYFREHGTTLRGLMIRHGMDPADYLDYVHDIDLAAIVPDPALTRGIEALPGRKVIFTNSTETHASRVVERLGIAHHFEAIFDIRDADYLPKPDPAVYQKMIENHDIDAGAAVMVEDIKRNLAPAAAMGMATVWLTSDRPWASAEVDGFTPDFTIDDLGGWLGEVIAE